MSYPLHPVNSPLIARTIYLGEPTVIPKPTSLTRLPDRPKACLYATGKITSWGNWKVTELQDEGGNLYYKYQQGAGRNFEVMFYGRPDNSVSED